MQLFQHGQKWLGGVATKEVSAAGQHSVCYLHVPSLRFHVMGGTAQHEVATLQLDGWNKAWTKRVQQQGALIRLSSSGGVLIGVYLLSSLNINKDGYVLALFAGAYYRFFFGLHGLTCWVGPGTEQGWGSVGLAVTLDKCSQSFPRRCFGHRFTSPQPLMLAPLFRTHVSPYSVM